MNYKIVLIFVVSLVSTTMANCIEEDPEIKAEMEKLKTKICSADSRPTEEQWTEMGKCTDEQQKQHYEKSKGYLKDCVEKCTDIDTLKTKNELYDFSICDMCSPSFKQCKDEKIKKWKEGSGNKEEELKNTDQYKEKLKKYKETVKTTLECSKKILGIA